jgi:hypothetical protein
VLGEQAGDGGDDILAAGQGGQEPALAAGQWPVVRAAGGFGVAGLAQGLQGAGLHADDEGIEAEGEALQPGPAGDGDEGLIRDGGDRVLKDVLDARQNEQQAHHERRWLGDWGFGFTHGWGEYRTNWEPMQAFFWGG